MAEVEEEEYHRYQHQQKPLSSPFFSNLSSPDSDLQNTIHQHCLFFDRLVELVPARFYLPNEDTLNPGYYGMSKAAKAAAREATKVNLKKARRERLDPENYASTLELVKKNAVKQEQEKLTEEEAGQNPPIPSREEDKSVTYEELRKKLHKRIEELRSRRHVAAADNARNWKNEKKKVSQKGKRKRESVAAAPASQDAPVTQEEPSGKRMKEGANKISKVQVGDDSTKFEFGRVKISIGNEHTIDRQKKRKESKGQLLEKASKLQSTIRDPEKGQVFAMEHSWSAAASRAAGVKVLDNPKLLKQSLKKEKHQHQKSIQKWKERTEFKEKAAETKQQIRAEHIAQRNQQKKERLIAKREKKLLRPGFEGRKDGFINV
eukprot:Gb_22983 [translate_table: standard]